MKKLLLALLVGTLLGGCGGDKDSKDNDSKSGEINLDDPETRKKIIAEAIDLDKLQVRGKAMPGGLPGLAFLPNQQTPYTGWVKRMHENGQMESLMQFKDGKPHGLAVGWYENGQKLNEMSFKEGKLHGSHSYWYKNGQKKSEGKVNEGRPISVVVWKPNGEKCPVTNLVNGNGVTVSYNDDGTVFRRITYKDGEQVKD